MTLRRARHWLEAIAARLAFTLFGLLPVDLASGLAGGLARAVGPRLRVSDVARRNLARAFPGAGAERIEAIVVEMWDNLGRVVGEFPHIACLARERTEVIGDEHFGLLRGEGHPGIFFGGHLGNWEIGGAVAVREGVPVHLVYREANNPWVEDLYRKGRSAVSVGLVPKGFHGARDVLAILEKGGHLGMLVDQKMNDGIAVPFFGREAMTAPALATFAMRYRCPVIPFRVERLEGARFRLTLLAPLEAPDTGDRQKDVREMMVRVNALLEEWVRERPGQWLWLHRRWPEE